MEEIFLPVVGYEGLYEVSNYGNVRSLERNEDGHIRNGKKGNYHRKENMLKKHLKTVKGKQYYDVVLYKGKEHKNKMIHQLEGKAFLPNPENKPFIDHIDTNGLNNILTNLRWCTQKENANNPLTLEKNRIAHKKQMKPILQYTTDGVFIKEWNSIFEAIEHYNAGGGISNCLQGKAKTCKGFIWKYKSDDNSVEPTKLYHKKTTVIQYTLDGQFVAEYASTQEASRQTGIQHISDVCLGKRNKAGGFIWKYKEVA